MKKINLLLIMLAISLANHAQSNGETMKVETFTEYPSEIYGGSCAFYLNKSDKDKGCFFMVNDLCNTAYIKINGKMEVLKMENNSTESTIEYLNGLQKSFDDEVIRIENELRAKRGASRVSAVHRIRKNETQDALIEIFQQVQVPLIDLEEIRDPTDREFFRQLENIRNEIKSEEPPTLLKVFYKLIALSNLYNLEMSYSEIANLAILTQTLSNYESIISETDVRGVLFFLMKFIENYDSYQKEAYIRNGWVKGLSEEKKNDRLASIKKEIDNKVDGLFRLSSFSCGYEEYEESSLKESEERWKEYHENEPFIAENHICKVGHPAPKCRECQCKNWTYKEPVKCACWCLRKVDVPTKIMIPIEDAMKLYNT